MIHQRREKMILRQKNGQLLSDAKGGGGYLTDPGETKRWQEVEGAQWLLVYVCVCETNVWNRWSAGSEGGLVRWEI